MSLELCQSDLSNFPKEIIDLWLSTFVDTEGWPPCESHEQIPSNRWRYLLGRRPVKFWQNIEWKKEELSVVDFPLVPLSDSTLANMISAYVNGETNLYSMQLGEHSLKKFWSLLFHIAQHGKIPEPPVLINHDSRYEVLDGNHRISSAMAWLTLQANTEFTNKLNFKPVPFPGGFTSWVGYIKA